MLGGVLTAVVGGLLLYAGFSPHYDKPWLPITEVLGGKVPAGAAGSRAKAGAGTSGGGGSARA